jgi:beta-aspartyl-peptidase (threonine type)
MAEAGNPIWAIIVHGGAKTIPEPQRARNTAGVLAAATTGSAVLAAGGSALDAVEAAIRQMEDDPTFNAGFGSVLNADGEVELDASIMAGDCLAIGAVGAVQGIRHPISVARRLMAETAVLLAGRGARRFAQETGGEICDPRDMIAKAGADAGGDTVGCVALDVTGRLAAGLSTGGLSGKRPGRIGDTPLPGCGFFADDRLGGVAFSGDGESIARSTLAAKVMNWIAQDGSQPALERALRELDRVGGEAGGIALDRSGRFGCAHTSDHFAVAAASPSDAPRAGVNRAALGDLIHG